MCVCVCVCVECLRLHHGDVMSFTTAIAVQFRWYCRPAGCACVATPPVLIADWTGRVFVSPSSSGNLCLYGQMADDALKITVSYSGREKLIPLVVRPSIELTDFEVDQAELELCGIVRHVFNVPAEASFSLHEAETSRTLTKESFRDPGYIQAFPRHWYLTVEKTACELGEEGEEEAEGNKVRKANYCWVGAADTVVIELVMLSMC